MNEIDVSKCPYFVEEHEWWDIKGDKQITKNCCDICLNDELNRFDYDEKCTDNPNCYYKQLQQLKQENDELKENYRLSCLKCKFKNAFMILDEIEGIVKNTCRNRCTNDCSGTKKHCGYGKILQLIKQARGK